MLNDRYSQQVVKQMFDIGELFLVANDLEAVKRNYRVLQKTESGYRDTPHAFETCLQDTIDTSFHLCQAGLRGDPNQFPDDRALLQKGIGQLRGHLINHRFDLNAAKIAASRAAHLAASVLNEAQMDIQNLRYSDEVLKALGDLRFPDSHRVLGRLKAIPEALFHWSRIAGATRDGP